MPAKEPSGMAERMRASCARPASEQTPSAAGDELAVIARHRHDAAGGDVEGDHGDMRRRIGEAGDDRLSLGIGDRTHRRAGPRHRASAAPKAQTWRMEKTSAATCMAISACAVGADARAGDDRLGADAAQRRGRVGRCQSSGSGAAIMPARSTPSSASTLSTVLGSCSATTASVGRPKARSRAAIAEIARSACA